MIKSRGCIGILFSIIRLLRKITKMLVIVIANLLVYFGLWIPFFYLIFSGGLMLWGGLDIANPSVDASLFKFGLVLSLVCSAVITVKNLIFKPLNSIISIRNDNKEAAYKKQAQKERLKRYKNGKGNYVEECQNYYNNKDTLPPLIYRSAKDPRLIIHEYKDRFEVFSINNGKLVLLDINYKN